MTIKGHLDGLAEGHAVGWATSGSNERNCRIILKNEHGETLGEGLASRERADLSVLGYGRTDFAFRIPISSAAKATALHAFADGTELHNSPLRVGAGCFDGHFTVTRGVAYGWVSERTVEANPIQIEILDEAGDVLASGLSLPAANDHASLFKIAKFAIDLPQKCYGRGEIALTATANGVPFRVQKADLKILGNLESLSSFTVSGWLYSPSAPKLPFTLEIFRDGRSCGTARCTIERNDVKALYPDCDTRPGFSFALPPDPSGGMAFSTVSVRITGSEAELFKGPYIVGDRPAAVLAGRRVARLALIDHPLITYEDRAVLQQAMKEFLSRQRENPGFLSSGRTERSALSATNGIRLNVIIPVYRGIAITKACIDSVIATVDPVRDRIVIIDDNSPETGMAAALRDYASVSNVVLLVNPKNLGFVQTVNRGLSFCTQGDVILLNSDTVVFDGGLDELWKVAHSAADIGTATAISNNATIFSYPHPKLRGEKLDDVAWRDLARVAVTENRGLVLDVPTGHGFCLLIKREVLGRVGLLNESFGRGYGEENDFCARAADLGYRNVAAPGALVEHRESVSFVGDKQALLSHNIALLESSFPEYTPIIMAAERRDVLRAGRWALDAARLRTARDRHGFVVVFRHSLGGGTDKAIEDLESAVGYGGSVKIDVSCGADGAVTVSVAEPVILATFAEDETDALLRLIDSAEPERIFVHQLLGFPERLMRAFAAWARLRSVVFYAHDFFPLCPRVTMIDAAGEFCDVAATAVCDRCIKLGGVHEGSRLKLLAPSAHRALFAEILSSVGTIITPSPSAAGYLRRVFPEVAIASVAHPEPPGEYAASARPGNLQEIVLLGAIGPHKGSRKLLEIAQRAKLTHPSLRFHIIGYTDVDDALIETGVVTITGRYKAAEFASLCQTARGRLALFLSTWPETYSYTLSEAVRYGFVPLVPDIGALGERVRQAGYGVVFPFPIRAGEVLETITRIERGEVPLWREGVRPSAHQPPSDVVATLRQLLGDNRPLEPDLTAEIGRQLRVESRLRRAAAGPAGSLDELACDSALAGSFYDKAMEKP